MPVAPSSQEPGAPVKALKPALKRAVALNRSHEANRVNGYSRGTNGSAAHSVKVAVNGKAKNSTALHPQKVHGSKDAAVAGKRVNGNGKLRLGAQQNSKLPRNKGKARAASKAVNGTGGRSLVAQDRQLVDRCLSGDPTAWSLMYERFHGSLLASIRAFLGRAGHDMHLVDEISARVWYSLVRNDFELLAKFDPARGCRLSTFLSVLGKSEARLLLRSERRRKTRECVASRPEIEHPDATGAALADDDFLATLSPRERAFYLDILVAADQTAGDGEYSRQNQWQLRHRVRKKLEQFLE